MLNYQLATTRDERDSFIPKLCLSGVKEALPIGCADSPGGLLSADGTTPPAAPHLLL